MTKRRIWKMPTTLAAFGLALALAFTSCGGNDNSGGGGSGFLGETLNLSGLVYTFDLEDGSFTRSDVSRQIVSDPPGGTGAITDGQLSFTFGRPATQYLNNMGDLFRWMGFEDMFYDFTITPAAAMGTFLWLETATSDTMNGEVWRGYTAETATSYTSRDVTYVFVDRDAAISGSGITESFVCNCEERADACYCEEWYDACYCYGTFSTHNFNITLREGWNALHSRLDSNLGVNNTVSMTRTISHENPGSPLRWILEEWNGSSVEPEPSGRALPGRTDARSPFGRARR